MLQSSYGFQVKLLYLVDQDWVITMREQSNFLTLCFHETSILTRIKNTYVLKSRALGFPTIILYLPPHARVIRRESIAPFSFNFSIDLIFLVKSIEKHQDALGASL